MLYHTKLSVVGKLVGGEADEGQGFKRSSDASLGSTSSVPGHVGEEAATSELLAGVSERIRSHRRKTGETYA